MRLHVFGEKLRRAIALLAFEERDDGHRMAMSEAKVRLQPGHHRTRFHPRLELAALREAFVRREPAEVGGGFACFRLDVVEVGLK